MVALALVSALLTTVLASPASATYSGHAGRLAFVRDKQIYTVLPNGADVRQLTTAGKNVRPKWSPDGTRIAYLKRTAAGTRDVWVMSADGTNKTRVTRTGNVTAAATWSPDGTTLAFAAGRNPAYGQVYTVKSTAPYGSPVPVRGYLTNCTQCDPDPTNLVPIYADRFLTWSPDGTRIAVFNHDDAKFDDAIYLYRVATGEAREYAASGAGCCGYVDVSDLAWGPAGRFGYGAADNGRQDGVAPYRRIVYPGFASAEGDKSPAPAPRGKRMAFTNATSGSAKIYVAKASGAHRHVVAIGHQPDWQPRP